VFLSVFSTLKRSSSTLEKSTKLFLFRVLEFFFFVLFLFPREATICKTATRHLLRAL
jgi:hypothetical protein